MKCCNCDLGILDQPGVDYLGSEYFDAFVPSGWVCAHCYLAAVAVRSFCDALPGHLRQIARSAEVNALVAALNRTFMVAMRPGHGESFLAAASEHATAMERLAAIAKGESDA